MLATGGEIMSYENINALNAIAKKCNDEMKAVDKKNTSALRKICDKWASQARLIGFSRVEMLYRIGVNNGQLVER